MPDSSEIHKASMTAGARCATMAALPGHQPIGASVGTSIQPNRSGDMPKFVIERDMKGVGQLSADDLRTASQKSCGVLNSMGPAIQWIHSYVTDDRMYCIYLAPDESAV